MREDDDVLFFVQTWAEAVLRQLERVRAIREKDYSDVRAYEHLGEDSFAAQEQSGENLRVQWVEEHTLVWAAHQLERWTRRLALDRFEEPPEPDEVLAMVRNALEHLDEADFDEGHAIPGPLGSNRSLKMLPKGGLQIALDGGGLFLGLVETEELERRALAMVRRIEGELDAELQAAAEAHLEMMRKD